MQKLHRKQYAEEQDTKALKATRGGELLRWDPLRRHLITCYSFSEHNWLSAGKHVLVIQMTPATVTRALPQTTCHYGYHCDHRGRPEPGIYRLSIERRERAMFTTHSLGFRGEKPLSEVLKSLTIMGYGKGGEIWIYVTCYEGILDGRLYRKILGDGEDPTGLHPLIQWLNFIVLETRSLPGFPGMFTLTSPQRYTVNQWIAVHRRLVYLYENPNVKKLLDDGVYVEKVFPGDVFPAWMSMKPFILTRKLEIPWAMHQTGNARSFDGAKFWTRDWATHWLWVMSWWTLWRVRQ